jgi:diketogulonate reductase-like aldo/keto reductase
MIERSIPSSGDRLPVIGLGTWQTFDVSSGDPARARLGSVLQVLAHAGRSVMDSSPMYGTSEAVVGEMIEEMGLQDRFFIATKVWTEGRKAGIRQMEESMQRLRVDRIDLMQVHNLIDARTHLRTLQEWKQAGRVRYTGITHYSAAHHDALCRVARANNVDFIQVNYSVAEREAERRVLPGRRHQCVLLRFVRLRQPCRIEEDRLSRDRGHQPGFGDGRQRCEAYVDALELCQRIFTSDDNPLSSYPWWQQ